MPRLQAVGGKAQREVDPLQGLTGADAAGDDYDPKGFYVDAQDKHHHDLNTRMRLNPNVVAEVQRIIASGALAGTPIDGLGAFVRDAMHHNLERIRGLVDDPMLAAAAADARRLARADGLVREMQAKRKIVDDAEASFTAAMGAEDRDGVAALVELYEPMVDRLRAPYAGELEVVLKRVRKWLNS